MHDKLTKMVSNRCWFKSYFRLFSDLHHQSVRRAPDATLITVICLIEASGAIARLNPIPRGKNWGSELSNCGFRIENLANIKKIKPILVPQQYIGSPKLKGRLRLSRQNTVSLNLS